MSKLTASCFAVALFYSSCIFMLPTDPFIDGNTYVDPEIGFEITATSAWTVTIDRSDSTRAILSRRNFTEFQPTIRIAAGTHSGPGDIGTILTAALDQRKKNIDSLDTVSIRQDTVSIDTIKAGRIEFAFTEGRTRYRLSEVFVVNKGFTILISFKDLDSRFAAHRHEFNQILATTRVYDTEL